MKTIAMFFLGYLLMSIISFVIADIIFIDEYKKYNLNKIDYMNFLCGAAFLWPLFFLGMIRTTIKYLCIKLKDN